MIVKFNSKDKSCDIYDVVHDNNLNAVEKVEKVKKIKKRNRIKKEFDNILVRDTDKYIKEQNNKRQNAEKLVTLIRQKFTSNKDVDDKIGEIIIKYIDKEFYSYKRLSRDEDEYLEECMRNYFEYGDFAFENLSEHKKDQIRFIMYGLEIKEEKIENRRTYKNSDLVDTYLDTYYMSIIEYITGIDTGYYSPYEARDLIEKMRSEII